MGLGSMGLATDLKTSARRKESHPKVFMLFMAR
jgi:hypothetical protein